MIEIFSIFQIFLDICKIFAILIFFQLLELFSIFRVSLQLSNFLRGLGILSTFSILLNILKLVNIFKCFGLLEFPRFWAREFFLSGISRFNVDEAMLALKRAGWGYFSYFSLSECWLFDCSSCCCCSATGDNLFWALLSTVALCEVLAMVRLSAPATEGTKKLSIFCVCRSCARSFFCLLVKFGSVSDLLRMALMSLCISKRCLSTWTARVLL